MSLYSGLCKIVLTDESVMAAWGEKVLMEVCFYFILNFSIFFKGSTSRSPSITQLTSTSPLPPTSHSTSKKGFISVGLIFISLLFAFAFAM